MPVLLNIYNILNFNANLLNLVFQLIDLIVQKLLQRAMNLLKAWKNQGKYGFFKFYSKRNE
jgi:hypothetical protein